MWLKGLMPAFTCCNEHSAYFNYRIWMVAWSTKRFTHITFIPDAGIPGTLHIRPVKEQTSAAILFLPPYKVCWFR